MTDPEGLPVPVPGALPRAAGSGGSGAFTITAPIGPDQLDDLSLRLRSIIASTAERVLVCTITGAVGTSPGTLDTLARLQLLAHRLDCRIVLGACPPDLRQVLERTGLCEALPTEPPSG